MLTESANWQGGKEYVKKKKAEEEHETIIKVR